MNNIQILIKAVEFSAKKHKDQRRKDVDASPYVNHPIALARILSIEANITDIDVICGALLHDTVEDTDTSFNELEREFGENITKIVRDVTDDKSLEKAVRKQAQIDHAAHICDQAKMVKLADKISNLRDITASPPADWNVQRKQEYFDWAKQVVDQVRGVNLTLEQLFDEVYQLRPEAPS